MMNAKEGRTDFANAGGAAKQRLLEQARIQAQEAYKKVRARRHLMSENKFGNR